MTVGIDTITVYRGEDVNLDFTMNTSDDITGWTLLFTVQAAEAAKLIQQAATVLNSGQFRVPLTDEQTDQRAGSYQYDVWRTDSGTERCLAVGEFVVTDVARHP